MWFPRLVFPTAIPGGEGRPARQQSAPRQTKHQQCHPYVKTKVKSYRAGAMLSQTPTVTFRPRKAESMVVNSEMCTFKSHFRRGFSTQQQVQVADSLLSDF